MPKCHQREPGVSSLKQTNAGTPNHGISLASRFTELTFVQFFFSFRFLSTDLNRDWLGKLKMTETIRTPTGHGTVGMFPWTVMLSDWLGASRYYELLMCEWKETSGGSGIAVLSCNSYCAGSQSRSSTCNIGRCLFNDGATNAMDGSGSVFVGLGKGRNGVHNRASPDWILEQQSRL